MGLATGKSAHAGFQWFYRLAPPELGLTPPVGGLARLLAALLQNPMKTLSHDEVAQCAHQIWQEYGQPSGRDEEIWYEAERRLQAGRKDSDDDADVSRREADTTTTESKGAGGLADRLSHADTSGNGGAGKATAVPKMPAQEAMKAEVQKKEARAPKVVAKNSPPKPTPAPPGKPLYDRPHSS